jgi:hypothetical protein
MKILKVCLLFFGLITATAQQNDYIKISQDLLENIKNNKPVSDNIKTLENSTLKDLTDQLKTDDEKLVFWINIYNAFIQVSLKENSEQYNDDNRSDFFKKDRVNIAGEKISFDDIEHGIIRSSMSKVSMGYVKKIFRPEWERKLRVENIDWRIHFALNCGAKSCPPVAIYKVQNLNKQLDYMTETYLKEQTKYIPETKTAETVVLFSWFRGDFGGLDEAKKILKEYKVTPETPENLEFKAYDWTMLLDNFRTLPDFK